MKCYRDFFKKKIKTMNNKMAINTYLSTIDSKKQTKNHGYRESFNGCQMRGGCGGMGEEVRGLISINR